jgi:hypothetical protein
MIFGDQKPNKGVEVHDMVKIVPNSYLMVAITVHDIMMLGACRN